MGYITYPRTSGRGSDEKKALEAIRLIESLLNSSVEVSLSELQYLIGLVDWSKLSPATRQKLRQLMNLLREQQDRIARDRYLEKKRASEREYFEFQSFTQFLEEKVAQIPNDVVFVENDHSTSMDEMVVGVKQEHDTTVHEHIKPTMTGETHNNDLLIKTTNTQKDFYHDDLKVLYRAMSFEENDDIIQTNKWTALADSLEGKWFAETQHDALMWGNAMGLGESGFIVAQVSLPASIVNKMYVEKRLDDRADARFAQLDLLNTHAKIKQHESLQIGKMYSPVFESNKKRLYFAVELEWLAQSSGGRAVRPSKNYYCTTNVNFGNHALACSIQLKALSNDINKAELYLLYDWLNMKYDFTTKLNDKIPLLEGSRVVGYAKIVQVIT